MSSSGSTANIDPATSALLIIDAQRGFSHPTHWGTERSNPSFEKNLTALLEVFRSRASPDRSKGSYVFHVAHHSLDPASALHPSAPDPTDTKSPSDQNIKAVEFYPYATPKDDSEPVFVKNVNSAFIGTTLEATIRESGVKTLFITGLTTDHCVSTSVRMAGNLGVCDGKLDENGKLAPGQEKGNIFLVGDATATHSRKGYDAEMVMSVHLASLDGEFCQVVSTEEAIKMLQ